MDAIGTALSLLLLGGTVWWALYQRRQTPQQGNADRYEQIDQDIAEQDSEQATVHSTADLDELERLERLRDKGAGGA